MSTADNQPLPAAFLLIRTAEDTPSFTHALASRDGIRWCRPAFGPYQVVAYAEARTREDLIELIEALRTKPGVTELDARVCKPIPEDNALPDLALSKSETALLLINVDYRVEKERVVTCALRRLEGIVWARAMWGPADIIAIVEADDQESIRNLICDQVKVSKGVITNTTLYCYP